MDKFKDILLVGFWGFTIGCFVSYLVFAASQMFFVFPLSSLVILVIIALVNFWRLRSPDPTLRVAGVLISTLVLAVPVHGLLGSVWMFVTEGYVLGKYSYPFFLVVLPILTLVITAYYVSWIVLDPQSRLSKAISRNYDGLKILVGLKIE